MISRIIKVEVGVISWSWRLRLITLTETLIILDITETESNNCLIIQLLDYTIIRLFNKLYIERILSFSLWHKMFSKFVPTQSFFSSGSLSFFSFTQSANSSFATFVDLFVFVGTYLQLFFWCLAWSTKQTWKSCFCFFTDGKQHKASELDMITLRNHAPRSYMKWLPMTWPAYLYMWAEIKELKAWLNT